MLGAFNRGTNALLVGHKNKKMRIIKTLLFISIIGNSFNPVYSQNISNTLSEKKIFGFASVKYEQNINLDSKDTLTYVSLNYQNSQYTAIPDIQSIVFINKNDAESFISDLKSIVEYMGDKKNIYYDRDKYYLGLYDFDSKRLRVGKDNEKTTVVFEKKVRVLIDWLESLDLKYLN